MIYITTGRILNSYRLWFLYILSIKQENQGFVTPMTTAFLASLVFFVGKIFLQSGHSACAINLTRRPATPMFYCHPKRIIAKLYSSVKGSSRFSEMQDMSRMRLRLASHRIATFLAHDIKMNATNQTTLEDLKRRTFSVVRKTWLELPCLPAPHTYKNF